MNITQGDGDFLAERAVEAQVERSDVEIPQRIPQRARVLAESLRPLRKAERLHQLLWCGALAVQIVLDHLPPQTIRLHALLLGRGTTGGAIAHVRRRRLLNAGKQVFGGDGGRAPEPPMIQRLGRSHALLRVDNQQVLDEVLCVVRDRVPVRGEELVLARFDLLEHLLVVVPIEWWEATEQDVDDHADAPQVDLR